MRYLLAICFLLVCIRLANGQEKRRAVKGVLDLRSWDWNEKPNLNLDGEWLFEWGVFSDPAEASGNAVPIKVPSIWNNLKVGGSSVGARGYGTYRLTILVDPAVDHLALYSTVISTAYRVYIDGAMVNQTGQPGTSAEVTVPHYLPQIIPVSNDGQIDLVFHVSNFHHRVGGIRDRIQFGSADALYQKRQNALMVDVFLAGCFIIMGMYHFILYVIKEEMSPLYFSIFCLVLTVRLAVTGNIPISYYVDLPWNVLIRIEFLTFYLGVMAFLGFFDSLFRDYLRHRVIQMVVGFLAIVSLTVLFLPTFVFTSMLQFSQAVVLLATMYVAYILIRAHKAGNKEAAIFLFGFSFILVFSIHDLLHVNELIQSTHLFSAGLFIFLISQAILLSRRYAQSYKRNIYLVEQLDASNKVLESKVEERTSILEQQKKELEENNEQITSQNKELTKLNKELDQFVYSVSHDLKSPLASILGLIDLSKDEKDLKTLRRYHDMMERSLNRQNEFISEILDYSRNARLDAEMQPIDFHQLIKVTMEQYQFIEDWEIIKKEVVVKQTEPFVSDRQRISVILNNLISNALKYSSVGTSDPTVKIDVRVSAQEAKIHVEDNGCGIKEDKQEHIFDMFFRADDHKSGSGLGLYIVQETANRLDATVHLKSTYGEGTTVEVTIPASQS